MSSFAEDMAKDLKVFFNPKEFGVWAGWNPRSPDGSVGYSCQKISGIFDREYIEVEIGETVVQEYELRFTCATSDLAFSPDGVAVLYPSEGDLFAVNGTYYKVIRAESYGVGVSVVKLKSLVVK